MVSPQIASAVSVAEKSLYAGETLGFWIQTGAFVLSAVAAVAVIWHAGGTARRRATIDLILGQSSNKELTKAISIVYSLHSENKRFVDLKPESLEHNAVKEVLNYLEFVSLGIRRKAFDGKIFKELKYSDMMSIWESSHAFIADIRATKKKDTIYQEFEWLITEWKKKPLCCIKR